MSYSLFRQQRNFICSLSWHDDKYIYFFSAIEIEERPRVTKFTSGDDLDDDFMIGDASSGKKDQSTEPILGSASNPQESPLKSKKKQGPKVVNFVG